MIRIIKPIDIPEKLRIDGVAQTRRDCRAYEANKHLYISKGKKPKETIAYDQEIYGCRKTVKPILLTAHNYKCCYCEKEFVAANLHVEHFRPKTRVKQALGESVLYPGYYWLMYEWDNLFLACHGCNSSNKGDLFPLNNERARTRSHKGSISREQPLFIKPSDDARLHITFNLYGQPEPLTPLGDRTIINLGLLRDDLIKARLKRLIEVLKTRSDIEDNPSPANSRAARKLALNKRLLRQARSPLAEFSAMANDVLDKTFDTVEHLLKLEAMLKKYM